MTISLLRQVFSIERKERDGGQAHDGMEGKGEDDVRVEKRT